MTCNFRIRDWNCWQELDEGIIYSQHIRLRLRNIQLNKNIKFVNIVPCRLVLLNKSKMLLDISIETVKYTIMARLDKCSLSLKMKYRIFQKNKYGPIQEIRRNFLLIVQNYNDIVIEYIQLRRNKLIRKNKGKINNDVISSVKIAFKAVMPHNIHIFENYFIKIFELLFRDEFISSIKQFYNYQEGHKFKKLGDFLILKTAKKVSNSQYLPIYYVQMENGKHGRILILNSERLKMIKCFGDNIYIVLKQNNNYLVFKIDGESERLLIYSITNNNKCLKKPIIQRNYIILTNRNQKYSPSVEYFIKQIDYQGTKTKCILV